MGPILIKVHRLNIDCTIYKWRRSLNLLLRTILRYFYENHILRVSLDLVYLNVTSDNRKSSCSDESLYT